MNLQPGGVAAVAANVLLGGDLSAAGTLSAVVFRNGIATTVVVTVSNPSVGLYVATFTVPPTWVEYDRVDVRFSLVWGLGGETLACMKTVGVVTLVPNLTTFISELLTADQVRVGDKIYYYAAGTGQTVLLHEQDISGASACAGDVSLVSP